MSKRHVALAIYLVAAGIFAAAAWSAPTQRADVDQVESVDLESLARDLYARIDRAESTLAKARRKLATIEPGKRGYAVWRRIYARATAAKAGAEADLERVLAALQSEPPTPPVVTGEWVDPAETGARGPLEHLVSSWGWQLGVDLPLELAGYDLSMPNHGAVVSTFHSGIDGPTDWMDVRIHGALNSGGTLDLKWGERCYPDGKDWTRERCTYEDVRWEHGSYLNLPGTVLNRRNLYRNIMGQALQYVARNNESPHGTTREDWTAHVLAHRDGWQRVIECAVLQVGNPPKSERASYALSFFEIQDEWWTGLKLNPVRVQGCYIASQFRPWVDPNGVERDCAGAVMAHDRLRFEMVDTYIRYPRGDRSVVQVWYCGDGDPDTVDVLIQGGEVWAEREVDIRIAPGDRVMIQGVGGDATVTVSSAPRYVFNINPADVIYSGPLSADWGN